jgi:hypothetical protein
MLLVLESFEQVVSEGPNAACPDLKLLGTASLSAGSYNWRAKGSQVPSSSTNSKRTHLICFTAYADQAGA